LVLFCVLGAGLSFKFFLIIPINTLILHPGIFEFFQTLVILFPIVVIFFFTFIVLLIILSVILILIFLIVGVLILPIEIKPFIDMGDTKEYGDIVINSLYTLGFAIGLLPLIDTLNKIDFTKIPISILISDKIQNLTIGNVTDILKNTLVYSINDVSMGSILKYTSFISIYLISVFLAISILIVLHYNIKKRKNEELSRIEGMISCYDFVEPNNFVNRDRKHYLLSLYSLLLSLHEWPVKRFFILDLVISALLLFISRLVG